MKTGKTFLTALCIAVMIMNVSWSLCVAGDQGGILDMTYAFDEDTIYWPMFTMKVLQRRNVFMSTSPRQFLRFLW
jgi:hypothetical protein